jgi:hypothetical protein
VPEKASEGARILNRIRTGSEADRKTKQENIPGLHGIVELKIFSF